jgi:arylformamidase
MRLIDVGGLMSHDMWPYSRLFPAVEVSELPCGPVSGLPANVQAVYTPMLASTYLETAAHIYPQREKVADLPLERLFTEAVFLRTPRGPKEAITSELILDALRREQVALSSGDSLLLATGWEHMWDDPDFITDSPYFTAEAMEWILEQGVGLLGTDAPQWDDGRQGFFPRFFESDCLLLSPLVNLSAVSRPRVRLVTLPLKLAGVSAAPCRAIVIEE